MGIYYTAPPTIGRFMRSNAFGRILAGPVGSGKTTGCIMEVLRRCIEQAPASDDKRYTRWAFIRQTLKQLKDTVLRDMDNWLAGLGTWQESKSTYFLEFGDVQSEWLFIPLEMSDWHKLMTEPPNDWQIFIQPSGLDPAAENLAHLVQTEGTKQLADDDPRRITQGRKYYERFLEQYPIDHPWIKRYVLAQYGDDPSGEAVFRATFKPSWHVVDETFVIPGYPLVVGQDFGRNPWSVIGQVDHMGRLLIHEEVPASNIGLEKHINENLKPRLYSNKFIGSRAIVVGDPSGVAKGTIAEESCFDALRRLGLSAFPAPTNDIDARLRAVEALLGRAVNAGPALCINRRSCPWLVRAMSGGYRYARTKQGGLRAIPEKLDKEGFSHVADSLQYIALVVHGNIVNELMRRSNPYQ